MEFAYLNVRLGKVPSIKPTSRAAMTDEQKKRIKALIAKLAEIKDPDFGMSATLTGEAFAPLSDQAASAPLGVTSAVVLLALAFATLWSAGVRGWFAPLRHGPRAA